MSLITSEAGISVRTLATGNGLHVDLDENGNISLVLWGISESFDDDVTIFEAKLTPEQEHRILHAETVDAWGVDERSLLCLQ